MQNIFAFVLIVSQLVYQPQKAKLGSVQFKIRFLVQYF